MKQKQTFSHLLAGLAVLLAVLPAVVTFSAVLTALFNKFAWYVWLQATVVPFEARLVAVLLKLVKISAEITPGQNFALILNKPGGIFIPVELQWNCLGWQSLILLALTLITGLKGKWKLVSKVEVLILGIAGTFLVNLLRMALVTSLAYYVNGGAAMIIHDYFAALIAILWLIFFWWFSYKYILEEASVK